ncbi:MAG: rhodanese-like domain-containing protein, partial [Chloroflexota bacterium]
LSAFFAGLGVTVFNSRLCDCFLDYGETTSEMMMLLAFILFGAVLSTMVTTVDLVPVLILAMVSIILVRPFALGVVLGGAKMSATARLFIGWFGPRGLGSLLLALLAVQGGVEGADMLLAITGVVVLISVVLHGSSATPLGGWYGRKVAQSQETFAEERESTFSGLFDSDPDDIVRIEPNTVAAMIDSDNPPLMLDVRARAHFDRDNMSIPGSVRIPPDHIKEWAEDLPRDRIIVAYCACPDESASGRASRLLIEMGFDARALRGGWDEWREQYPIVPQSNTITADMIETIL